MHFKGRRKERRTSILGGSSRFAVCWSYGKGLVFAGVPLKDHGNISGDPTHWGVFLRRVYLFPNLFWTLYCPATVSWAPLFSTLTPWLHLASLGPNDHGLKPVKWTGIALLLFFYYLFQLFIFFQVCRWRFFSIPLGPLNWFLSTYQIRIAAYEIATLTFIISYNC